jgi:DNA topoisomerase-1
MSAMDHEAAGDHAVPEPIAKFSKIAARAAGLRYVSDARPGIRRIGSGKGFRYIAPNGRVIRDADEIRRIKSLAIPPAYRDVWICPDPNGHIQATARDARGRKQYRYHQAWREIRDAVKYDRMLAFAEMLPRIRESVDGDLESPGLSKRKVIAAVVRLLETTHIRIGNEEYSRVNRSFGLTTLRNRHVEVLGDGVRFHFRGKSGKEHKVRVHDRRLARIVRRCLEIPGLELFEYLDEEGRAHVVDSGDVNEYLREIASSDFSAKDFRTWAGTVTATKLLVARTPCRSEREAKREIQLALAAVASELGNTPAVCRKAYVHPVVLESYRTGLIYKFRSLSAARRAQSGSPHAAHAPTRGSAAVALETDPVYALTKDELFTLHLLRSAARRRRPSRSR